MINSDGMAKSIKSLGGPFEMSSGAKRRLYISKPEDRESVVIILARNGYTVREGKERSAGKTFSFVEFWREGDPA